MSVDAEEPPLAVIVDVPAVSVRLLPEKVSGAVVSLKPTADEPKDMARVPVPLLTREVPVTLKLAVLKVPLVTVITSVVKALPKVQPPPTPLKVTGEVASETPLVVIVLPVAVDARVREPVRV